MSRNRAKLSTSALIRRTCFVVSASGLFLLPACNGAETTEAAPADEAGTPSTDVDARVAPARPVIARVPVPFPIEPGGDQSDTFPTATVSEAISPPYPIYMVVSGTLSKVTPEEDALPVIVRKNSEGLWIAGALTPVEVIPDGTVTKQWALSSVSGPLLKSDWDQLEFDGAVPLIGAAQRFWPVDDAGNYAPGKGANGWNFPEDSLLTEGNRVLAVVIVNGYPWPDPTVFEPNETVLYYTVYKLFEIRDDLVIQHDVYGKEVPITFAEVDQLVRQTFEEWTRTFNEGRGVWGNPEDLSPSRAALMAPVESMERPGR